jgi:hypothetical protein
MEENSNIDLESRDQKSKALPLFIFLFLTSLALCAFLFFKYVRNASKIQDQNEELTLAYGILDLKADSLQKELDFTLQQLQDKINENLALTDLKDDLRNQLESKSRALTAAHARISKMINGEGGSSTSGGPKNLLDAKREINTLKQSNAQYIAKVEQLQKDYEATKTIADDNGYLALTYKSSYDSALTSNNMLEKKLSTASIIRVAGLKAEPLRSKKGKQELIDKANKVEQIRVYFSLLASELSIKEDKELKVRIIAPNGVVLSKTNDKLQDSDEVASISESITYDGTEKGVSFYYKQTAEYKSGNYKVELYHEDKLLDRTSFTLR